MLGGLDVLVNNAGMILQGGIEATPPAAWRELLAVNLTAAFLYSKACFGPIRDGGGGSIVHIVSDTGIRGIALDRGVLGDEGRDADALGHARPGGRARERAVERRSAPAT